MCWSPLHHVHTCERVHARGYELWTYSCTSMWIVNVYRCSVHTECSKARVCNVVAAKMMSVNVKVKSATKTCGLYVQTCKHCMHYFRNKKWVPAWFERYLADKKWIFVIGIWLCSRHTILGQTLLHVKWDVCSKDYSTNNVMRHRHWQKFACSIFNRCSLTIHVKKCFFKHSYFRIHTCTIRIKPITKLPKNKPKISKTFWGSRLLLFSTT